MGISFPEDDKASGLIVLDNLTWLCDKCGSRFGGTPGEPQAAKVMQFLNRFSIADKTGINRAIGGAGA
jgi:hypothetical protein